MLNCGLSVSFLGSLNCKQECSNGIFHIVGPASVKPFAINLATERIVETPFSCHWDNIVMRIEVHGFFCADIPTGDEIQTGVAVGVRDNLFRTRRGGTSAICVCIPRT